MALDHIGIAVERLADATPVWEATLGTRGSPPEEVTSQAVRVVFLETRGAHLELLEATRPDSGVGRFVASRGGGLHHLAFRVPSVDEALRGAEARGLRLIDRVGRPGARGRRVGFVHPAGHRGVLVEFVEEP